MKVDKHPFAASAVGGHTIRTPRPLSLKAIITLLIGALLLITLAGLAAITERTLSQWEERHARDDLGELAAQLRYRLDRGMSERYRDVVIASSLDTVRAGSPDASRRLLERLKETYSYYSWIGLVDAEGTVVASTGRLLEGQDVSGRDWFQAALSGPHVGDVHLAQLLANLLPRADGRELRLVDIAAPVYGEEGELMGVLGAHLNWEWAREIASSFTDVRSPEEHLEIYILSEDGAVLLSSADDSEADPRIAAMLPDTAAAEAIGFITGENGRGYLAATSLSRGYGAYPGLGWRVVVRQPTDVAFEHVGQLRRELLLIGAALTLSIMIIGWVLARWIGQPLGDIAQSAVLERSGTAAAIPPSHRYAEVHSLADSLRALVADLRLKQDALRASAEESQRHERFLSAILSNIDDGVFVNKGGKIVFANEACAQLFGVDDTEAILGHSPFEFFHEHDHRAIAARIAALAGGEARLPAAEERVIQADGTVLVAEVTAANFVHDGGPAVLVLLRDITARKSTERQLQHAQRLEAVGQLTGGMAHDFNNLLTVTIGNLDLLLDEPKTPAKDRELLELALQGAMRGAELTRQLLAFSRRQSLETRPFDFNELVGATERLLRRTLGERIRVRLALADDLWPALADPAQVESALANLAINARDAMPNGGDLTIATGNRTLDEQYASENVEVNPGDYVMLTVSDSGVGMSPEVLVKAYEPFFTTKTDGKGSGLGLAMIYGFAKQSGGHVKIYSEVGYGTTVALYLPRADDQVLEDEIPDEPVRTSQAATILVVDDDPAVRTVVVRQIAELGHNPLEAADAATALEIIGQGQPIDLLFTDIVMPGMMTGPELAAKARELRPDLKILFTSGFAEAALENRGEFLGMNGLNLLSKPYRKRDLERKIAEALSGDQPERLHCQVTTRA